MVGYIVLFKANYFFLLRQYIRIVLRSMAKLGDSLFFPAPYPRGPWRGLIGYNNDEIRCRRYFVACDIYVYCTSLQMHNDAV